MLGLIPLIFVTLSTYSIPIEPSDLSGKSCGDEHPPLLVDTTWPGSVDSTLHDALASLGPTFNPDETVVVLRAAPLHRSGPFDNLASTQAAVLRHLRETSVRDAFWPTRSRPHAPDGTCTFVHFDRTTRPLVNSSAVKWQDRLAAVQFDDGSPEPPSVLDVAAYDDLSGAQVLARAAAGDCLYVAEILRLTGLRDVLPNASVFAFGSGDDYRFDANLWLGTPRTGSFAHYDTPHNVFLQLMGTKMFTLYPHRVAHEVGVHPFVHPLGRQFMAPPARTHASLALQVTLAPGDLLYLPPFLVHETSTVAGDPLSVGLNVWTEGKAAAHLEDALRLPLPFDASWPTSTRLAAVAAFATAVYPHVPTLLLRQRVEPLAITSPAVPCAPDDTNASRSMDHGKMSAVAATLSRIDDPIVRDTQALNHLEQLVMWAVQFDPDLFVGGLRCVAGLT